MKKTILLLLLVIMVATPCFADKVEPDGLFRLEETLWEIDAGGDAEWEFLQIGFYQGSIYWVRPDSCFFFGSSSYKDFLIFSIFEYFVDTPGEDYIKGNGILLPFWKIGFFRHTWYQGEEEPIWNFPLKKITDSWIPSTDCFGLKTTPLPAESQ